MKTPKATFNFEDGQSIIRGINYYPQHTPWQKMWEEFDSTTLQMDMQKIKSMSFNTIRVFVPFHAFGGASLKPSEVEKLITMLDIADQEGLKVIVTLFDFFLGYQIEEWTLSDRHAEGIVSSIKNHPALLAWDVKNEPDLDYKNLGKRAVNNWLSFIIKRIRTYDSSTPITIGWSQPEAMVELKEEVDFLSFHYYRDPKELPTILSSIQTTKPIFLGETGMHSFDSWWYPFKNSEKDQLTFYQEIGAVIEQKKLHYAFWTLYDFKSIPSNVAGKWAWQKGPQKSYGMVDSKDNEKPSFNWIQDFNKTPIKERK